VTSTVLPRIETESLTQKAQTALREHILSGKLKPGTRLVESQLAEQLGVSRAPVREVLLALEAEGLVASIPGKGAFVAQITEEDLQEIYTVRSVLEGLAMRLAARRMDRRALRDLSEIVERMKEAAGSGDAQQVADADLEFHEYVWKLSGHRRLYQLLTSIMSQIRMFLALNTQVYDNLLDNCLEHVALYEALSSGDAPKAERLMCHHISEAGRLNIDYLHVQIERAGAAAGAATLGRVSR
jgi:DNA-binding GntR family transcriptional regulator